MYCALNDDPYERNEGLVECGAGTHTVVATLYAAEDATGQNQGACSVDNSSIEIHLFFK